MRHLSDGSKTKSSPSYKPTVLVCTSKWYRDNNTASLLPYPHISYLVDTLNSTDLGKAETFFFDEYIENNPQSDFVSGIFNRIKEVNADLVFMESITLGWIAHNKRFNLNQNEMPGYKEFLRVIQQHFDIPAILYWPDFQENPSFVKQLSDSVLFHQVWDFKEDKMLENYTCLPTPTPVCDLFDNNNPRERETEIAFVGAVKNCPDREEIINYIKTLNIKSEIYSSVMPGGAAYITNEILADLYKRSKMVINFSLNPSGRSQVKARIFEATLCGALLLEQENDQTPKYFEPYVEYVPWKDARDLEAKIKYYLENDIERNKIAENGSRKSNALYSGKACWKLIFDTINQKISHFNCAPKGKKSNFSQNSFRIEEKLKKFMDSTKPHLMLEGLYGFNIVRYRDKFYAIPQKEGSFEIFKVENQEYQTLYIENSLAKLQNKLTQQFSAPPMGPQSRLQKIWNLASRIFAG